MTPFFVTIGIITFVTSYVIYVILKHQKTGPPRVHNLNRIEPQVSFINVPNDVNVSSIEDIEDVSVEDVIKEANRCDKENTNSIEEAPKRGNIEVNRNKY